MIPEVKSWTPEKHRLEHAKEVGKFSERLKAARLRGELFRDHHPEELAQARGAKLADCGSWLIFRRYFERAEGPIKLHRGYFCQQPLLCEFCAARRGVVSLAKALPKILAALTGSELVPYLLTLTAKNREHLPDMVGEVLGAWRRLLQQRRESGKGRNRVSPWAEMVGGIMSFETKVGKYSGFWHFHGHAVVLGRPGLHGWQFWDAWSELLGYPANMDLRPLDCVAELEPGQPPDPQELVKDLCEVFKYAVKMCQELSANEHWTAYKALRGKRLLRPFGVLHGCKEEKNLADDCSQFEGEAYEELVYRFLNYRLQLQEKPKPNAALAAWNEEE